MINFEFSNTTEIVFGKGTQRKYENTVTVIRYS